MKCFNLVASAAVLLTVWACPKGALAQIENTQQLVDALDEVLEEGGSGRSICRCECGNLGGPSAATQRVDFENITKEKNVRRRRAPLVLGLHHSRHLVRLMRWMAIYAIVT